eukprot:gene32635-17650_t
MIPPGSETSIDKVLASLDSVKAELGKPSLGVKPSKASLYTGMEPPASKASMDFNIQEVLASLDSVQAELLNASRGVNPTLDKDKATLYTLEPPGSKTSMDQHIQEVLGSLDSVKAELLKGVAASLRMESTSSSTAHPTALSSPPSNFSSSPPSPPSLPSSYLCVSTSFQSSSISTSYSRSSRSFSPCSLFDQPKASLYTGMEPPASKASMDFNIQEVLASLDSVKAELFNASRGVNPTLDKDKATLYTLEPPGSKTSMDQHIQEPKVIRLFVASALPCIA